MKQPSCRHCRQPIPRPVQPRQHFCCNECKEAALMVRRQRRAIFNRVVALLCRDDARAAITSLDPDFDFHATVIELTRPNRVLPGKVA